MSWKKGVLAFAGAAALFIGCKKEEPKAPPPPDPNRIVAEVNGTSLRYGEMETRAKGYLGFARKNENIAYAHKMEKKAMDYYRRKAIETFVYKTLMLDEAKRRHLTLSPFDEQQGMGELARALKIHGTKVEDFFDKGPQPSIIMHQDFKDGLLIDKLLKTEIRDKISADDTEVSAVAAQVNATNSLRRALLENIRKKILAGASFAEMARQYSEVPSGRNGGDMGEVVVGQNNLDKTVEMVAISQKPGEVGPIFETSLGYHIIKVHAQIPGRPATETTPSIPDMFQASEIVIRRKPVNRIQMSNAVMGGKYKKMHQEFYGELKRHAKIVCYLFPDMKF